MKTLLTFLAILIGISCYGQEEVVEIKLDSTEAPEIFQERDYIQELKDIVLNYYDNWMLDRTGKLEIDKAYHTFYDSLLQSKDHSEYMEMLKMNQRELDSLIVLSIDRNLFLSIWKISYSLPGSEKISYELAYRYESVYSNFLKQQAKKYKILKEYLTDCEEAGEIPKTVIYGFPRIHNQFDFTDENIRLIFAMHFVTSSYKQNFKKIYQ